MAHPTLVAAALLAILSIVQSRSACASPTGAVHEVFESTFPGCNLLHQSEGRLSEVSTEVALSFSCAADIARTDEYVAGPYGFALLKSTEDGCLTIYSTRGLLVYFQRELVGPKLVLRCGLGGG